ncbi:DUF4240 domain-containing protein [Lentzea sp. NBRC 102530]|uniref:DUF4240 domain-containing protein n=1 Tax=Lentzea sp. NBRC 102530 TaxID=3032201 RepID=UPI0024A0B2F5|nr:DUF4240 domain-containing protein [Lentzea sp. NBRC 102530]GLY50019.1 hypothetical protein Lesp01_36750 [Lentzea sp. NBRC 102530]
MDLNAFWVLIEGSCAQGSDRDTRQEWLAAALAVLPAREVVEFAVRLDEVRRRVDTWALWHAAAVVHGGYCGTDSFFYFQSWLIGLGREVFESVAADPDALAGVPEVRALAARGGTHAWSGAQWPEWEGLAYVAAEVVGEDALPAGLSSDPVPAGVPWDFADPAEIAARVPRLGSLFGKVA